MDLLSLFLEEDASTMGKFCVILATSAAEKLEMVVIWIESRSSTSGESNVIGVSQGLVMASHVRQVNQRFSLPFFSSL